MRTLEEIFHAGEIKAQQAFNEGATWSDRSLGALNRMFQQTISDEAAYFMEDRKFFFISTSNKKGECDCNFRGTEPDANGKMLQSVLVVDASTIVFPDYAGNRIYNSLGNIMENPNIGMLFIDFNTAVRLRVNGDASIIYDKNEYIDLWPKALRYIKVGVRQVYFNCQQRIKESVNI